MPMKWLLITAGTLALVSGVIGIVLPLLPTTPFLLLAAGCYLRSSPRLYDWLLGHRWLGPPIRNYREHRAVSMRLKVVALTTLWGAIGYSALIVVENMIVRGVLVAIAIGVTVHLVRLRTL
jgi:uncharacterized membrane protein YbaN (DUF454 family)